MKFVTYNTHNTLFTVHISLKISYRHYTVHIVQTTQNTPHSQYYTLKLYNSAPLHQFCLDCNAHSMRQIVHIENTRHP